MDIQSLLDAQSTIHLPEGDYILNNPLYLTKSNTVLYGDNPNTTRIISYSDTPLYIGYPKPSPLPTTTLNDGRIALGLGNPYILAYTTPLSIDNNFTIHLGLIGPQPQGYIFGSGIPDDDPYGPRPLYLTSQGNTFQLTYLNNTLKRQNLTFANPSLSGEINLIIQNDPNGFLVFQENNLVFQAPPITLAPNYTRRLAFGGPADVYWPTPLTLTGFRYNNTPLYQNNKTLTRLDNGPIQRYNFVDIPSLRLLKIMDGTSLTWLCQGGGPIQVYPLLLDGQDHSPKNIRVEGIGFLGGSNVTGTGLACSSCYSSTLENLDIIGGTHALSIIGGYNWTLNGLHLFGNDAWLVARAAAIRGQQWHENDCGRALIRCDSCDLHLTSIHANADNNTIIPIVIENEAQYGYNYWLEHFTFDNEDQSSGPQALITCPLHINTVYTHLVIKNWTPSWLAKNAPIAVLTTGNGNTPGYFHASHIKAYPNTPLVIASPGWSGYWEPVFGQNQGQITGNITIR